MARSSFGPKELTPTAMSIPLPAGDYPTNLILPPLYHLPATNRARVSMIALDLSLNPTIATNTRWRVWFNRPSRPHKRQKR